MLAAYAVAPLSMTEDEARFGSQHESACAANFPSSVSTTGSRARPTSPLRDEFGCGASRPGEWRFVIYGQLPNEPNRISRTHRDFTRVFRVADLARRLHRSG
jgi:hypothetical protein